MSSLSVVLKVSERCNLNCSYCYYFNGLDNSYKFKPAIISLATVERMVAFLIQGIKDYSVTELAITLHGGEPLLLKKTTFEKICTTLRSQLSPFLKNLDIIVQTNGTLIDNAWIDLFKEHQIKLGISLDGSKANHDKYRVTHKGKGSYDRIIQSIELLHKKGCNFGVLAVIDPSYSAKEMFEQFIIPYKITGIDFLWPDFTNDSQIPYPPQVYGRYVADLFDYWVAHGKSSIQVRFFSSHINLLLGVNGLIYGQGIDSNSTSLMHVLAIRSDGEVCPTDELMSTDPENYSTTGKTVYDSSLKDIFTLPVFDQLTKALSHAPNKCRSCCWKINCGGGNLVNRFSQENQFNNPSVYCDGLKIFYSNLLSHLVKNGISRNDIAKNLQLQITG